ncbi:MAG TPA: hypothetical protein VGL04_05515, partial [Sporichthyaceae bacterium]
PLTLPSDHDLRLPSLLTFVFILNNVRDMPPIVTHEINPVLPFVDRVHYIVSAVPVSARAC